MKVLVNCEKSQIVCKAFRHKGHEAYSCDILPCEGDYPEWHLQMDCFEAIELHDWDLMIAHPECTYLTVSANRWLKDQPKRLSGTLVGQERRIAKIEAMAFFIRLFKSKIEKIAIENPIGCMSTMFRKPDQVLQPWMFGHGETKATCLWLKGLPTLKATKIVSGRDQRIFKLSPSKSRSAERSKTFAGIAEAMADQWG